MLACLHVLTTCILVFILQWLRARFYEKEGLLSALLADRTAAAWSPVRFSSDQVPASRRLLYVGGVAAEAVVMWCLLSLPTSLSPTGYAQWLLLLWRGLVLVGTIACCAVTYSQSGIGLDGLALMTGKERTIRSS